MSRIRPKMAPPQKIETIEYEVWQISPFKILQVLEPLVIKMFQEHLNAHTLEYFQGPYRNLWFLVIKLEPGKYRII